MLRYWIKLLNSNDNFLPKKVYRMLKTDIDNNKTYSGSNWAYQIKCIFKLDIIRIELYLEAAI